MPARPASLPLRAARAVYRVGRALWDHDALDAAGSMAFNFFLSLIPLLLLAGFLLGNFVRERGVDPLMDSLLENVPPSAAELVRAELQRMAGTSAGSVAPLSVAGFLWLTSSGAHHMMDVLEAASKAPKRPWWKQRVIALASVVLSLGALCLTAWVLVSADNAVHTDESAAVVARDPPKDAVAIGHTRTSVSQEREPPNVRHRLHRRLFIRRHAGWESLVAACVSALVAMGALAAFFRYAVEHPPGIRRRAWPGAAIGLTAWFLVSWAFGSYVTSLGRYAVFYGSLAAVAVLLVWLYLTSLSLLLGAEVNAQLEGLARDPA